MAGQRGDGAASTPNRAHGRVRKAQQVSSR